MAITDIAKGTKLQMALSTEVGDDFKWIYVSTFSEALDESAFLISAPLEGNRPMYPDENQKYMLKYAMGNDTQIIAAYCDNLVKKGVRHYWKMRRVSELRQFFTRSDERYKVSLRCEYIQSTWALNYEGKITPEDAMTLDVSAGGAALFLNYHYDIGEVIQLSLPRVGTDPKGKAIENIISTICWYREVPKGGMYKHCCGVQFRFATEAEREELKDYVSNLKEVFKL